MARNQSALNEKHSVLEVLKVSTLLGLTSFGGPTAHLGYFHKAYVEKHKWIDEHSYADLVALCQFLPGPASSQIGIGIGTLRSGLLGGIAAWLGFTLPSAIALLIFAVLVKDFNFAEASWLQGLKVVAVAIVAHSVLGMGKKLASEKKTATIAVLAMAVALFWQMPFTQVLIILASGIAGVFLFKGGEKSHPAEHQEVLLNHKPLMWLGIFAVLLLGLPILMAVFPNLYLHVFDSFYRSGSLVFGGGHVVLPLLELELVPSQLVTKSEFLAGYGAAQAVPGPLFTFASYLGGVIGGLPMATVALVAIFLPSFLLVLGVLPYWQWLRSKETVKRGLIGVNAAVVGILLAALYDPLWTTAITGTKDFVVAAGLFGLLTFWKTPSWMIVLLGGLIYIF